ncbi:hypothetical protein DNK47_01340 [Mycoplasma wenyonii]|uniref:Uncharacterized protein n=1 Tax=Mycoplasma wenyonii TaxID=65123 RepID=A0A328PS25_9MOLU|nr:hypothetical protein [Mycoplasma wenyonii]RAO95117.1 hypothetical protein DNK47_01340 [Mycoplasma wenyonii]
MGNKVSIYLLFKEEKLSVKLINYLEKKVLSQFEIPFLEIVPKLIELVELKLVENQSDFSDIDSVFLAQRESRWNSNRLVVAFVKALGLALPINIYKGDFGLSGQLDYQGNWDNFFASFEKVSWKELEPLYNKCPIINT